MESGAGATVAPVFFDDATGARLLHVAVSEETRRRGAEWLPEGAARSARPLALEAQADGTLRLQMDLHTLWERPLGGAIAALAANEHFAVAVVADADDGASSCLVYSFLPGVLVLPRLVLPGAPAALCLSAAESGATHLMVVTVNAHVAVWDLVRRRSLLQVCFEVLAVLFVDNCFFAQVSAAEVLRSPHPLVRCVLAGERQQATLVLANGSCFGFCPELSAWTCLHDAPKYALSDFHGSATAVAAGDLLGPNAPLFALQTYASAAAIDSLAPAASAFFGGKKARSSEAATMYHLEQQVQAAWQLRSWSELRYWAQTYAAHLVDRLASLLAFEDRARPRPEELLRLRALCEFLMGERQAGGGDPPEETAQRRLLLRDIVLPILSTQGSLASWVQRYSIELQAK